MGDRKKAQDTQRGKAATKREKAKSGKQKSEAIALQKNRRFCAFCASWWLIRLHCL
jgi:hypothetical protein